MSAKELKRLEVIRRVLESRWPQARAGALLGLTTRQVRRLCRAFEVAGPSGLVSRKRGRKSNRRLTDEFEARVMAIVREHYGDFGPKLAQEKLLELHDLRVGRETLRKWMASAGLWLPRRVRLRQAHQPRHRRECRGELVQIDGCDHEWFENRGPRCALLVYVDDATGDLMELRFARSESAYDYFVSTRAYLARHGRPVAFYSDKHAIFRVTRAHAAGASHGVTQFGRALADLNIEIICANSPQAKGRVERMNKTLQDRLVKELRLRGISTIEGGNAFLPEFMAAHNRRFGRLPRNAHDAHRPLQGDEDLDHIFAIQEDRKLTANLVIHFQRMAYLVVAGPDTLPLAGKTIRVFQWEDGRVELHYQGRKLPFTVFDKNPCVPQGAVVEHKRLGAALAHIQAAQAERDRAKLASRWLTLREKERIRAGRLRAGAPQI